MRILVSNDDGIQARGLITLAQAMLPLGEVTVVAPNRERSAASHSLTLEFPLRVAVVHFPVPVKKAWAVSGTPSDCVKLALSNLLEEPPDLVVTGINRGANMNVDVFYSGTVAAAFEGIFAGVPALAFSLASYDHEADFAPAGAWARTCVERVLETGPLADIIYNVNVPALSLEHIKGLRLTRLGNVRYRDSYDSRKDPNGKPYFWLKGEAEILDHSPECDIVAVREGFVSLTPIRAELTDFRVLEHMQKAGFAEGTAHPPGRGAPGVETPRVETPRVETPGVVSPEGKRP